jgi:hypothetical protein
MVLPALFFIFVRSIAKNTSVIQECHDERLPENKRKMGY